MLCRKPRLPTGFVKSAVNCIYALGKEQILLDWNQVAQKYGMHCAFLFFLFSHIFSYCAKGCKLQQVLTKTIQFETSFSRFALNNYQFCNLYLKLSYTSK